MLGLLCEERRREEEEEEEMYGFVNFGMDLYGLLWVCMDISLFHF